MDREYFLELEEGTIIYVYFKTEKEMWQNLLSK